MTAKLCQETEHDHLRHNHAHEHREWIDGGVGHGGSVVVGRLVGIGEGRGIGVGAAHHTDDGEIVHLVFRPCEDTYHNQGHDGDDESVEHPEGAAGVEHRGHEVLARRYAH